MSLNSPAEGIEPQPKPEYSDPLHVLDLPQLHQKPPASSLLTILSQLAIKPSSWDATNNDSSSGSPPSINEEGIPAYLTRIIMSPLGWLPSEGEKEEIWEAASKRLAERSGRTAMPSVSRTFTIPTLSPFDNAPKTIDIKIHEPSLTGDNLGHKTWLASYLLSKRLPTLMSSQFSQPSCPWTIHHSPTAEKEDNDPPPTLNPPSTTSPLQVLELGSGTGLVGLAFSALFTTNIHLTDLPPILPNLTHNIATNAPLTSPSRSTITSAVLDWHSPHQRLNVPEEEKHDVILAADSLYMPEHVGWLVGTMDAYLKRESRRARIFVELPFRADEPPEHDRFRWEMGRRADMECLEEGVEVGFDDWEGRREGERVEVKCWWSVWRRR